MIKANEAKKALKPSVFDKVSDSSKSISIASGKVKQPGNSVEDLSEFHPSNLPYEFVTTQITWD